MGGERFITKSGVKDNSWEYSKSFKGSTWRYSNNKKSSGFSLSTGITAPSWNQKIDDTSEDWTKTWDWVFMTTYWENLDIETGNWEDWK